MPKNNSREVIAVDVDDVVAGLVDQWLKKYNNDYNDNLKADNITDWEIGKFTKIGDNFYKYLTPELYTSVRPLDGALEGVKALKRMKYEILFATVPALGTEGCKFDWLVRNGFLDKTEKNKYYETNNKGEIEADILLDDSYKNITAFHNEYKTGILFRKPWNRKNIWSFCTYSWPSFVNMMKDQKGF